MVLLIAAVLGSIYSGIATATEAAASAWWARCPDLGRAGLAELAAPSSESLLGGTRLYCMIALILAGAAFLTLAMGYIGLPRHLAEWIAALGLTQFQLLIALMLFYILLGCFLDGISMVVLTMGVILPTVQKAGIDPLWFGIFVVLVVEMAQITPPVGFNLFVLQGMTRREIGWIARVTLPFFFLMVAAVALIYLFPQIVTGAARRHARLIGRNARAIARADCGPIPVLIPRLPRGRLLPVSAAQACRPGPTRRPFAAEDDHVRPVEAAAVAVARGPLRASPPLPSGKPPSPGRHRRLPPTRRRGAHHGRRALRGRRAERQGHPRSPDGDGPAAGVAQVQVPPARGNLPLRFAQFRRLTLIEPLAPAPRTARDPHADIVGPAPAAA